MMRFVLALCCFFTLVVASQTQSPSCLFEYKSFNAISPELLKPHAIFSSQTVLAWYTNESCFLLGTSKGLWLYDIEAITSPIQLVATNGKFIENIAVNPHNSVVAFSIQEEPIAYFINSSGFLTSIEVSGDAITEIAFSPDGQFVAIASSDLVDVEVALQFAEARIEVWDREQHLMATIPSQYTGIIDIFFSPDNQKLLFHSYNWGYEGDHVEYWDMSSNTRLWTREDLLRNNFTTHDPLLIAMVAMHDETVFLGGVYGWHDYDDYLGTAIHIWNAESLEREGELIINYHGGVDNDFELSAFSLNCDGTELVTAQYGGMIRFWRLDDLSQLAELAVQEPLILSLSYNSNCRYLTALGEGHLLILNRESMELETSIQIE